MKNGKAGNLALLSEISGINVPRFIVLDSSTPNEEYVDALSSFLDSIPQGSTLAVRSSGVQEDSVHASFAGMYTSKLQVPATMDEVLSAVAEVQRSGEQKRGVASQYASQRGLQLKNAEMSVIVQIMIEPDLSGVIFSHDLNGPDGYYSISVSRGLGENIVGGISNGRLIRIVRGISAEDLSEPWIKELVCAMKIIEQQFQSTSLDVEFAVQGDTLHILQCRPITTADTMSDVTQEKELCKKIESLNRSIEHHFSGDILGDMIDINPAELLGQTPSRLDVSIFRYLFADKIVERVRRDMGYDPLDVGLLQVIAGKPYVSMRASAYSFRPLGISDQLYERMVRVYRDMLAANPALQNRVEFEVYAMSCGDKLEQVMRTANFEDVEKHAIRQAFESVSTTFAHVSATQAETFNVFAANYEQRTTAMSDASPNTILAHVLDGTEMFVRVARLAFYWKNQFEEVYPHEDLNDLILGHMQSVHKELETDLLACKNGSMSPEQLVQRYGHLRPGQFSVFGESYADDPETYLFAQMEHAELQEEQEHAHAFEQTAEFKNVVTFMQARERMKFLFSQSLYIFAMALKQQLEQKSVSKEEASRMDWSRLNACLGGSHLAQDSTEDQFPILLPDVIIPETTHFGIITFSEALPSYITNAVKKARVCVLEKTGIKTDVRDALVVLPNADPGYDFLFHSGAAGIITKVGGPASHMCIRAIELQMPACIGCGEDVYHKLMSARSAVLDCNTQQIIVLD